MNGSLIRKKGVAYINDVYVDVSISIHAAKTASSTFRLFLFPSAFKRVWFLVWTSKFFFSEIFFFVNLNLQNGNLMIFFC